ncbi:hypothetical protein [Amycolatopsis sulphurea]|nr:hypothetical protein [Amycolatopsis sulphurea]
MPTAAVPAARLPRATVLLSGAATDAKAALWVSAACTAAAALVARLRR